MFVKDYSKKFRPCISFMPDEDGAPQGNPQGAAEYIEAIKNLKENSVDKKEYDKLAAERAELIKALSGEAPLPKSAEEANHKPDLAAARKKFLEAGDHGLLNYEVAQAALELRQAAIDAGEPDPFIPAGVKVKPELSDITGAQRVADALQFCIDEATDEDGNVDADLFNNRLKKILAEDSPLLTARLNAQKQTKKGKK